MIRAGFLVGVLSNGWLSEEMCTYGDFQVAGSKDGLSS